MLPTVETWRYGPSGETYLVTLESGRITAVDGPVDPAQYAEAVAFHDKRLIADFLEDDEQPSETPVAAPIVNVVGEIRSGGRRPARRGNVPENTTPIPAPSDTGTPGTTLPGSDVAGTTAEPTDITTFNPPPSK